MAVFMTTYIIIVHIRVKGKSLQIKGKSYATICYIYEPKTLYYSITRIISALPLPWDRGLRSPLG